MISNLQVVVRSEAGSAAVAARVRQVIADEDPNLVLYNVETFDGFVTASVAQPPFRATLLAMFAGLALALAAVGLYGVVSYGVVLRRRELSVRMALGARPAAFVQMVLRGGIEIATGGLLLGGLAAAARTRLVASELSGVAPLDPVTYATVAVVLFTVTLVGSCVPAVRAIRVRPNEVLRAE